MKRFIPGAVLICVLLASPTMSAAQGCSMCATATGGPDDPLARGLSKSTMFMVSMPFAVVGSIAGWLVISTRRAKRRRDNEGTDDREGA